jgi:2-phospho-L-lactate guanylyltransferase (CobY/MobA/RfbA family)
MWKTLGGFTAQISRFQHILPLSTAQINCSGSDLPFFRKPHLGNPIKANRRIDSLAHPKRGTGLVTLLALLD